MIKYIKKNKKAYAARVHIVKRESSEGYKSFCNKKAFGFDDWRVVTGVKPHAVCQTCAGKSIVWRQGA